MVENHKHYSLMIRVDATKSMGIGHFMRCLAFAQICKKHEINTIFVCKSLVANLNAKLVDQGFPCIFLNEEAGSSEEAKETLLISKKYGIRAVLIDGYHFSNDYYSYLNVSYLKVFLIDDFGNIPSYSHMVLNFQPWADTKHYPAECKQFLGLEYFLLRKDFWPYISNTNTVDDKVECNVLVNMGGTDPFELTLRIMNLISKNTGCLSANFSLVIGARNRTLEKLVANLVDKVQIFCDPKNIPFLMSNANLAITAGGGTCWELAFMQVPTLVIMQAENQEKNSAYIEQYGIGVNLGFYNKLSDDKFIETFELYLTDKALRRQMQTRARNLNIGNKISEIGQYVKNICE